MWRSGAVPRSSSDPGEFRGDSFRIPITLDLKPRGLWVMDFPVAVDHRALSEAELAKASISAKSESVNDGASLLSALICVPLSL